MADATNRPGFATRAIHAGQEPDPTTGAIMTPIYATSTYVQSSPGVHQGFEYARTQNPTRMAYERCIADLEGGQSRWLTPRCRNNENAVAPRENDGVVRSPRGTSELVDSTNGRCLPTEDGDFF